MFTFEDTDSLFKNFTTLDMNMEISQSILHSHTALMLTKEWAIDNYDDDSVNNLNSKSENEMEDLFDCDIIRHLSE